MDKKIKSKLNINSLSTGLILLDNQANIREINSAAEQLLGFSSRQITRSNFFDLVQGDLTQEVFTSFRDHSQTGFIEDVEMRVANGIIRTNIMVTPLDSEAKGDLLLELQTSTHQQNIRKDLQIQHDTRVSEHLIRNLAHEIKNPLGGIKGAAQLLERKLPEDFPDKYSQIIIRETDRLGALVDRLLMPAKIEDKQLTNPHILLERAIELVTLQFDKSLQINRDYDPSLPEITIAQNQIQQALLNLLKNSAEAITQYQGQGELTVRTRIMYQHTIGDLQYKHTVKIEVEDNGMGIDPELAEDIFFPTISGKQSSGLGLSIAQSLVQRNLGIIELEQLSNPTKFAVYLPVVSSTN